MNNQFNENIYIVFRILIFNFLITIIYFLWSIYKKNYKKGFLITGFMILTPIIGPLYLAMSWITYEAYFKKKDKILSMEELSLRKEKIELIKREDIRKALNKVSVEEALIISSSKSTRKLLLDIIKEESEEYITSIYKAADSNDSEVSHYAATAITDIMDKFKKKEKMLRENYEKKDDDELLRIYWIFLKDFLKTNILSEMEQKRYLGYLEKLTIDIDENKNSILTGEMYYDLIDIIITSGKIENAQLWVEKVLENRSDDLYSYKAGLKYYYSKNNREKYIKLLKELMSSNIKLDRETLELIRFYNYQS